MICQRLRWPMNQVHLVRSTPIAVVALLVASFVGGCGLDVSPSVSHNAVNNPEPVLPVVSGSDLGTMIQRSERPLLVEFGVNFGCQRCEQMRSEMTGLVREIQGIADVVRVDFNANRQLAAQFGVFICPSYVLFDQRQVVARHSFPTSADLLAADLELETMTRGRDE